MQKGESRKEQDSLIEKQIPSASVAVMRYAERQFAPVEVLTREFEYPWEGELVSFAPWDLQSLTGEAAYLSARNTWRASPTKANQESLNTAEKALAQSVLVDTDQPAGPYPCTVQEFRLWPAIKRDGCYQGIRLRPFGAVVGAQIWKERRVEISGTWGFPEIPADVKEATAFTVLHWLTVNTAVVRRPDDNPNLLADPKRGIPPEAKEILDRYKRRQFN